MKDITPQWKNWFAPPYSPVGYVGVLRLTFDLYFLRIKNLFYLRSTSLIYARLKKTVQRWRVGLLSPGFDIQYRREKNMAADALSRLGCIAPLMTLKLHKQHYPLCHFGVTGILHLARSRSLPSATDDRNATFFVGKSLYKTTVSDCRMFMELKIQLFKPLPGRVINARKPFERLSMNFKDPLSSVSNNTYLLTIVDDYSHFAFALVCSIKLTSINVISLCQQFSLCGMTPYIHTEREVSFMSGELDTFLLDKGIETVRTAPYN